MLPSEEPPSLEPSRDEPRALPPVLPDDPASAALQSALATGQHWLGQLQSSASRGNVDGVHHLRTTTRRLRSALELFRPLCDPSWVDHRAEELKWLADALGAVRDLDVLRARIAADGPEAEFAAALGRIVDGLRDRHDRASAALRDALASARYAALTAALAGAAALNDGAWEPCRKALPPLVNDAWTRLKRAGRALKKDDPDADFHEVRKRAKRARYAAEAVREALGHASADDAKRFARRAKDVQDVLGAHQDAVLAAAEVRRAAAEHPDLGPFNFAAGQLLQRQLQDAADARRRFFNVWNGLDRKKVVRWLTP